MMIRALAVMAGSRGAGFERVFPKLLDCLDQAGIRPWTLRAVLPPATSRANCAREAWEARKAVGDSVYLNAFAFNAEALPQCLSDALNAISSDDKMYASILCETRECLERVLGRLWSAELDPLAYTRVAVVVGEWVYTPYFPATASKPGGDSVAVAFRYAREFRDALAEGDVAGLAERVKNLVGLVARASECAGLGFAGADYSLSPWMDESVVEVVETVSGSKLGELGSIYGVRAVNEAIAGLAERAGRSIGFNEAMLAVAEDDLLDRRVAEGLVRLRDLVAYSAHCVAGVDMVAVPRERVDPVAFARDLWAVWKSKRRPLGVRVIPVPMEPGERLGLGRFGYTTVAEP